MKRFIQNKRILQVQNRQNPFKDIPIRDPKHEMKGQYQWLRISLGEIV